MIKYIVVNGDYLVSMGNVEYDIDLPKVKKGERLIIGEDHSPTMDAKSGERWNIKTNQWEDVRSTEEKESARLFEVQAARYAEYPSLGEFADAMYWQSKGDNSKLTAYFGKLDVVKTKFPKPVK